MFTIDVSNRIMNSMAASKVSAIHGFRAVVCITLISCISCISLLSSSYMCFFPLGGENNATIGQEANPASHQVLMSTQPHPIGMPLASYRLSGCLENQVAGSCHIWHFLIQ